MLLKLTNGGCLSRLSCVLAPDILKVMKVCNSHLLMRSLLKSPSNLRWVKWRRSSHLTSTVHYLKRFIAKLNPLVVSVLGL